MIVDFHCHVTTPGSTYPETDGQYYRTIAPINTATNILGTWTQDAMDLLAERWRTPHALAAYRNISPFIFTEMCRRMVNTDQAAMLGEMSVNGVNASVVVAMDPFVPTLEVLKMCSHLQGVLIPFGSVNTESEQYLDEFERLLTLPIAGIKYHSDLQKLPNDSPKLYAMMKILAGSSRNSLPVYLHSGDFPIYKPQDHPWHKPFAKIAETFPNINFVCGHAGWDKPRAALRLALNHPNIYLETSWQPPIIIRRLCDKLGPHRLLFGSDYPLFSQGRALRNVRTALNEAEFKLVAGENAIRLLGMQ